MYVTLLNPPLHIYTMIGIAVHSRIIPVISLVYGAVLSLARKAYDSSQTGPHC